MTESRKNGWGGGTAGLPGELKLRESSGFLVLGVECIIPFSEIQNTK